MTSPTHPKITKGDFFIFMDSLLAVKEQDYSIPCPITPEKGTAAQRQDYEDFMKISYQSFQTSFTEFRNARRLLNEISPPQETPERNSWEFKKMTDNIALTLVHPSIDAGLIFLVSETQGLASLRYCGIDPKDIQDLVEKLKIFVEKASEKRNPPV